ncbi:tRNA pseudouridine(13) synthase TruD [Legionella jordanis]|uniref:tRNA pseudouridine synthase D n=1 Tax=Legionella jordanis TaxID=456 RepID=A0A0W0VB45_9GAMM|nr:tRNA pseudouridine(13) synthase TruD [Legionella jordanis]KTD17117.1 hydrogenase [Legionella jordanis]RMX03248.1 tRNA pseudouridine(13) synthase TruD [Legionella jordanis]VEH12686.1 hydrogenase [Legionella jordanis]HAT8713165.1 tRNA pseudouridine(13) synthase TruD [Legionella jordanis]
MSCLNSLAFAFGKPISSGQIKASPEDFQVREILGFEPSGHGEHLFLQIEKIGMNTEELHKALARTLGKSEKLISYAGLKDKNALTTQWFSVHCPGEEIPFANELKGDGWKVINSQRHLKKLKTGALLGNEFQLVIREVHDFSDLEKRLELINQQGVPNYFGAQRFGYEDSNLLKAEKLLFNQIKVKNRFLRGIYYSAARSFLFNRILSERVACGSWNKALAGDVMQLAGKNSIFPETNPDEEIARRIREGDISPAAPLWGVGENKVVGEALELQKKALSSHWDWCDALEKNGLELAYRPMVLKVEHLNWDFAKDSIQLSFKLKSGSYATSVIRELLCIDF